MGRFRVLGHVADLRLRVEGDSLESLFGAALAGLAEVLDPSAREASRPGRLTAPVALEAPDATALLVDFLSEVLSLSHARGAIYGRVEFTRLEERALEATIRGDPVKRFERDVKAVTYHEAEIRRGESGGLETLLVLDV